MHVKDEKEKLAGCLRCLPAGPLTAGPKLAFFGLTNTYSVKGVKKQTKQGECYYYRAVVHFCDETRANSAAAHKGPENRNFSICYGRGAAWSKEDI